MHRASSWVTLGIALALGVVAALIFLRDANGDRLELTSTAPASLPGSGRRETDMRETGASEARASEHRERQPVNQAPGLAIAGDVTGPECSPIVDAFVVIVPIDLGVAGASKRHGGKLEERQVATDQSGRFEFRDVGTGLYSLQARGMGFSPSIAVGAEAGTAGLKLQLGAPRLLINGVVTSDDKPTAGVRVRAVAQGAPALPEFAASVSRSDGAFWIAVPRLGIYTLHAEPVDDGADEPPNVRPLVLEGVEAGSRDVPLRVLSGFIISGTLVNGRRAALPDDWLTAVALNVKGPIRRAKLGRTGGHEFPFRFTGLAPDDHELVVKLDSGGSERRFRVTAGSRDIRLEVRGSTLVRGRVVGRQGEAVAFAAVELNGQDAIHRVQTRDDGRFEMTEVDQGSYVLTASSRFPAGKRSPSATIVAIVSETELIVPDIVIE